MLKMKELICLLLSMLMVNCYDDNLWRSRNYDVDKENIKHFIPQADFKRMSVIYNRRAPVYNVDPPDHNQLIPMARYVMHNSNWASIATISTVAAIQGFPFSNVKSVVDGSMARSTGVPYFYMSPLDFTAKDLKQNSHATVMVSLEETGYCQKLKYDPEDPRCTRLMLAGKIKRIQDGTPEYDFAKAALFERHPSMADFPADHDWFVAKLKLGYIAMVDWFGGAKVLPVRDYLAYNYTGSEMLRHYSQHVRVMAPANDETDVLKGN